MPDYLDKQTMAPSAAKEHQRDKYSGPAVDVDGFDGLLTLRYHSQLSAFTQCSTYGSTIELL